MSLNLSYIIATRNRLSFLKITLQKLIAELQHDEEIVVVDGNSTDGSKEFLQQLFSQGKIHQYLSEQDKNQAHAWNKAMLVANGIIIKKIIDDDVFCYKAIRECKAYMLANPAVDVLISNDLSCDLDSFKTIQQHSRFSQFQKWSKGFDASFTFGDVHMLVRKSSLSYIGLYNTAYVMMDWEYALRISYLQANISYYSGYNALSVTHPQNVSSLRNNQLVNEQSKRGNIFYEYKGDKADISFYSKVKIFIGKLILREKLAAIQSAAAMHDIDEIYNYLYGYINDLNSKGPFIIQNSKSDN